VSGFDDLEKPTSDLPPTNGHSRLLCDCLLDSRMLLEALMALSASVMGLLSSLFCRTSGPIMWR
jgi:hypothetical protein